MIIGKYEIEDVSKNYKSNSWADDFGWITVLPTIEYRHKYWYLWEFTFTWLGIYRRLQISRTDWNKDDING